MCVEILSYYGLKNNPPIWRIGVLRCYSLGFLGILRFVVAASWKYLVLVSFLDLMNGPSTDRKKKPNTVPRINVMINRRLITS